MDVKVEYNGRYPNLCSGKLYVTIFQQKYEFPDGCLSSGGSAGVNHDTWEDFCTKGPWTVTEWPKEFPEEYKGAVTDAVNSQINEGCCGGCI